jgi:ribosomal-protein-alanine N-acetyltransferase
VISDTAVRLATRGDAAEIAAMSREYIERGLPWSWTEERVARAIENPDVNVAVVVDGGTIIAFGIMSYREEDAHLTLFAVRSSRQRQRVGSLILRWLEDVAQLAGVRRIQLECRKDNAAARNFYAEHGYHEYVINKGYYRGIEDAIQLQKWLVVPE